MRKRLVLMMTVLMILTLAVGCSQNSEEMSESNEDIQEITLCESWAFEQFFPVLTPENSTNYGLSFYLANFYETLVNYEAGQIVPGLAESWSVSEDGLVYTFNLREGVKFSDGTDFNAAVVKKNLEMIPKLLGRFSGEFAEVTTLFKEIRVIDPSTVEIHLSSPYYAALQDFTKLNPLAMISPKAFNEDGTLSEELLTATLGTGPYRYEGQHVDHVYTFTKNPYYWGEEPEVDLFHIKVIPDNQAKALALRSGEIDMIFGASRISYDGFQEFSQDNKYRALISTENIKTRFICFNLARAPFNEPEVRLAISQALDKQEICDHLFYGIETGADTFLSRSLPYCDIALEPYQYNVDQAKEILAAAGWQDSDGDGIREKDGQQLSGELLYISGRASVGELALTLSSFLKEIGMDIKPAGIDFMAHMTELRQGNYDLAYCETHGIPYEPYSMIYNMNPDRGDYGLPQGLAHLKNANEIIADLLAMSEQKEIQQTYNLLLTEIHQNLAFVPLSYMKELVVFNADKISDYRFHGQPSQFDAAGIRLKKE